MCNQWLLCSIRTDNMADFRGTSVKPERRFSILLRLSLESTIEFAFADVVHDAI